jgi:predicted RNA-binding Zn-ribbon protein involved in translation (DUF1610 family)
VCSCESLPTNWKGAAGCRSPFAAPIKPVLGAITSGLTSPGLVACRVRGVRSCLVSHVRSPQVFDNLYQGLRERLLLLSTLLNATMARRCRRLMKPAPGSHGRNAPCNVEIETVSTAAVYSCPRCGTRQRSVTIENRMVAHPLFRPLQRIVPRRHTGLSEGQ